MAVSITDDVQGFWAARVSEGRLVGILSDAHFLTKLDLLLSGLALYSVGTNVM